MLVRSQRIDGGLRQRDWIGYREGAALWLLDQAIANEAYPLAPVATLAYAEDPQPGRGAGAVVYLEVAYTGDAGSELHETLAFTVELTCRVLAAPTCTAPLATEYRWLEWRGEDEVTRESRYEAEFDEDAAATHLLVAGVTQRRGAGDPGAALGIERLRAGRHAYEKLLTRPMARLPDPR